MARVLAAMSGGVDSSVAAALCVGAGYETLGVTLKLLSGAATGSGCCGSAEDFSDAKRVCEKLGIPHYVSDFGEVFERAVVSPFVEDYLNRRTPNPCVECNRSVKFGSLLRLASAWGCDYVATGHYARIFKNPETGRFELRVAADPEKDQTYFLHSLTQGELGRILFPLENLTKTRVRLFAGMLGLRTAEKPESQEVCFVPGGDYRDFVRLRAGGKGRAFESGPIRDKNGRRLGTHSGFVNFTIGQRRGLGAAVGKPRYVTGMDPESNTLLVGAADDASTKRFLLERVSWTGAGSAPEKSVGVRIRHRAEIVAARLDPKPGGTVDVHLDEPQKAVAPGQTAVFYDGERVLGGGTIREVL
ncbi:MAG: tRNA 2-thiouridine(34) synthase MnmA [Elusimicrobiota bacterium]